ncbi:hypothetical protein TcWFU_008609 [Taenia crassiceps]|uniref:Uncharacterized protein n=1 Tax=Taenia crassiceps TaxID=6207 RepID=A0ABR4Q4M7_9CEST
MRTRASTRRLRSSTIRKTHELQPQKRQSSKKKSKRTELPLSSNGITSIRKPGEQAHNGTSDASHSLSVSKTKRRGVGKRRGERSLDSHEVRADRNYALTNAFDSPSDSSAVIASGEKKRKFFQTPREGSARRTALLGFELLRQKLTSKPRGRRRPPSAAGRIFSSRAAKMSASERARIAAATILLPLPKLQFASTPQRLQPQLLPLLPPDEKSEILTGNPAVRLSSLSVLASPSDSRAVELSNTPLESTAVIPREGSTHGALPLADISNISPWPQAPPADQAGDKIHKEAHRVSFAQPLSPIPKRSSVSQGSSNFSTSASKVPSRLHSRNEDASSTDPRRSPSRGRKMRPSLPDGLRGGRGRELEGLKEYEEWLKQFNSQLKPYEEFELTID